MNLNDQIDALDAGIDQLIRAARDAAHASAAEPNVDTAPTTPQVGETATAAEPAAAVETTAPAEATAAAPADKSTLNVSRPSQNEITLTVNGQSITLHPEQLGQLIEELAHARASMQPEQPMGLPPGWRFVATRNPLMAVQKQSNGDRLMVLRHTGYGWVPFSLSPDVVIQMYMLLTQK